MVAGKAVGITAAAWLAARTGLGRLPEGSTWPMVGAIATVAGIGFTVSLFVAELAFVFAMIGVDSYQASPGDIQHANVGGGELVVVDVTDPTNPHITPGHSTAPPSAGRHTR